MCQSRNLKYQDTQRYLEIVYLGFVSEGIVLQCAFLAMVHRAVEDPLQLSQPLPPQRASNKILDQASGAKFQLGTRCGVRRHDDDKVAVLALAL